MRVGSLTRASGLDAHHARHLHDGCLWPHDSSTMTEKGRGVQCLGEQISCILFCVHSLYLDSFVIHHRADIGLRDPIVFCHRVVHRLRALLKHTVIVSGEGGIR